jgi:hypothetical protein
MRGRILTYNLMRSFPSRISIQRRRMSRRNWIFMRVINEITKNTIKRSQVINVTFLSLLTVLIIKINRYEYRRAQGSQVCSLTKFTKSPRATETRTESIYVDGNQIRLKKVLS